MLNRSDTLEITLYRCLFCFWIAAGLFYMMSEVDVSAERESGCKHKATLTDCCIVLALYMQHIQIQLKLPFTQQMLPLAGAQATNKSFHPHTFKRQASQGTHSHSASVCARQNRLLGSRPMAKVFQHHWSPNTNITGTKAKSIQYRSVLGGVLRPWLSSDGKRATRQTYFSKELQ